MDTNDEHNDVPQKQQTLDAATRQAIMRRMQGLDQDIAQAEAVAVYCGHGLGKDPAQ